MYQQEVTATKEEEAEMAVKEICFYLFIYFQKGLDN